MRRSEPGRDRPAPRLSPTAKHITSALAAGVVAMLAAAPAHASLAASPFADATPMAACELAEQRGGMEIAGINFDFAVHVTNTITTPTQVLSLVTQLEFNAQGQIQGYNTSQGAPQNHAASAAPTTALPQGGVTLSLDSSVAQILQRISPSHFDTTMTNTGNNTSLNTLLQIDVVAPHFAAAAATYQATRHIGHVGNDGMLRGLR